MDLMRVRRRMMAQTKKSRLPSEYQEAEWIESTGTQWIDTGILGNDGIKIECRMGWVNSNSSANHQLFGARSSSRNERFYITSYSGIDFAHDLDHSLSLSITARQLYNFVYDTTTLYDEANYIIFRYGVNESIQETKISTFNTNLSMYIFGTNRTSYTTDKFLYPVIFASMIITDSNGIELFNGIPCYRKSDGEIGIYDIVTKTFLTNQGTGIFLKGADV